MSVSARRNRKSVALVLLACASAVPMLLVACKQPAPAVVDAGPPPAATDAAPAVLVPLDEDAGSVDASDAAPAHHVSGGGLNLNQARMKQCCAALAKTAGTDPTLNTFVVMCNSLAIQMGPTAGGQAPEFAALRNALKGHNVPAVCSGL